MRLRVFDVLGMATFIAWLVWIGVMLAGQQDPLEGAVERLELSEEDRRLGWRDGIEWQGIYLKDQKVGYIKLKKWRAEGQYHMASEMILHLTVMRTRQKIRTDTTAVLGPDLTLERFEVDIKSGPSDMHLEGVVDGANVKLSINSGGGVQTQDIALKEPPRLNDSLRPLLMRGDLSEGQAVSMAFFDPMAMQERALVFTYLGRDSILVMDQEVEAHVFTQTMDGIKMKLWLNDIGEVLQEELPMGLMGVRETGVEARYGVASGTAAPAEDVIDAVSVTPKGPVFSPNADRVRVELSGLSFEGLALDGGRQRWAPSEDPEKGVLTMRVPTSASLSAKPWTLGQFKDLDAVSQGDQALAETLREALSAEPLIQSDDLRIRERTRRVVGGPVTELGDKRVLDVARKVSQWAFREIKKESVIGVPSALETLDVLRGDCNEHTTLVVAMLRSVGVPARPAVGIAYLPDRHRFFYHAWVEVWAGDWIAMDPTFGQFPADNGHVRFVTGGLSEQVEMFRVIGQLQLEHLR